MNTHQAVWLPPHTGEAFWVLGDLYTFKVTGKQTNGACTVIDQIIQPQNGPPPHIHHAEDETFFVLDGRFSFLSGDKEFVVDKGSFVYVPRGTVHTFKNIDDRQGRLLVTITPAGLETFFYAIGTPAAASANPPDFDPAMLGNIMQLAEQYQMEIIIPPGHR